MIDSVVHIAGNSLGHIQTQCERTVQFLANYNQESKYIQQQCRRYTQ